MKSTRSNETMKTRTILSLRLALAGAAALLTHTTFAQTWHTVDDLIYFPNADAEVQAMTTDPAGNVYAAGWAVFGGRFGPWEGLIQKSSTAGTTWQTSDVFFQGQYAEYLGIASDSVGNLYAVGDYTDAAGNDRWIVRRSQDTGVSWSTVDDFSLGGNTAWARAVSTDASGNVFVAGLATTTSGQTYWIVRKGTSLGSAWSTVDTFTLNGFDIATGVVCHPTKGIFVAGWGSRGTKGGWQWVVRRSVNGGATWSTVNTYASGGGTANAIGADASGNIYVVGTAPAGWVVRKGTGGTSWATVDTFLQPYQGATPYSFTVDAHGNLFVVGSGGANYATTWLVRENPGGTGKWSTVDSFQLTPGSNSEAIAATADRSGNVLVGGWGYNALGGSAVMNWLVRKATP
jgi:hypothetical protein